MTAGKAALHTRIDEWVEANRELVIALVQELVRIPSETCPPNGGNEREAQLFLADWCRRRGLEPDVYDISDVPGLDDHPLRYAPVECEGRPNVAVQLPGRRASSSRSLILSGHIDTVPAGDVSDWSDSPTSGRVQDGRLHGRGAYDMKAGVAANFAVLALLQDLGIELDGDLTVESVVDEEFAGGHGTIAARLRHGSADAVLIPEPSNLTIYRAHRGLRTARMTIRGTGGVTFAGDTLRPPVHELPALIHAIQEFGKLRNRCQSIPEAYADSPEPAGWMITKVRANDWGDAVRLAVPDRAEVELFWETMPGETQEQVERQFEEWLEGVRKKTGMDVSHEYRLRWMAGYQLAPNHPFVLTAEEHATAVRGEQRKATGAPFPCDLFLFEKLGTPAGVILGPSGNNAHAADEWVDLESTLETVRTYARIVCDWCNRPAN